jgi:hypothetical protein
MRQLWAQLQSSKRQHCQPLACRNVALTPANLAAWREHLARLDQALSFAEMLAPYLRHRLAEQRAQVARFLAEHDGEHDGEHDQPSEMPA